MLCFANSSDDVAQSEEGIAVQNAQCCSSWIGSFLVVKEMFSKRLNGKWGNQHATFVSCRRTSELKCILKKRISLQNVWLQDTNISSAQREAMAARFVWISSIAEGKSSDILMFLFRCSGIGIGGERNRNQEFRFRFRQCRYRNFWQEKYRKICKSLNWF